MKIVLLTDDIDRESALQEVYYLVELLSDAGIHIDYEAKHKNRKNEKGGSIDFFSLLVGLVSVEGIEAILNVLKFWNSKSSINEIKIVIGDKTLEVKNVDKDVQNKLIEVFLNHVEEDDVLSLRQLEDVKNNDETNSNEER